MDDDQVLVVKLYGLDFDKSLAKYGSSPCTFFCFHEEARSNRGRTPEVQRLSDENAKSNAVEAERTAEVATVSVAAANARIASPQESVKEYDDWSKVVDVTLKTSQPDCEHLRGQLTEQNPYPQRARGAYKAEISRVVSQE